MRRLSATLFVLVSLVSCVLLAGCPIDPVPGPQTEARFIANVQQGPAPLTVQFTDTSTSWVSPIAAWSWDFGDGTFGTVPNPTHLYTLPGTYTVSLTVSSAEGNFTKVAQDFIKVIPGAEFATLGPAGGTVTLSGMTLTVKPGALEQEVAYGFKRQPDGELPTAFDTMYLASEMVRLTHNSRDTGVFTRGTGNAVQPATLELPIFPAAVPPEGRTPAQVQMLAMLENGLTIPIAGQIVDTTFVAPVLRLPGRATYALVYRPGATLTTLDVPGVAGLQSSYAWKRKWRVSASPEILQQLTALRIGSINNPAPYSLRNFTQTQIDATLAEVYAAIQLVHRQYAVAGLRDPLLLSEDGAYTLIFYDLSGAYSPSYESFNGLVYRDQRFGNIVVDPRQLINVSLHNGQQAISHPDKPDAAQELTFASALTQELFAASYDAYDFPDLSVTGPADLDENGERLAINFQQALRDGLTAYLGQLADGITFARGFEENEYALLSEPLFAPLDQALPAYATAAQDFFFYLRNVYHPADALEWIASTTPPLQGILPRIEALFAAPPGGSLEEEEAFPITIEGIDRTLSAHFGITLAQAYWQFACDRGVEQSVASTLRPGDVIHEPYTLNEDCFRTESVITRTLHAPSGRAEFTDSVLQHIPPLTSRAVVIEVNPLATELTLTFNVAEWESDAKGNGLAVKAYRHAQDGVALAPGGDTLILSDFSEDPVECYAKVIVLISNLSDSVTSPFSMTAQSFAELLIPELQVPDTYVHACDPDYSYDVRGTYRDTTLGVTSCRIEMSSGSWRSPHEVSPTLWQHSLTVVEPPEITSDTALLVISGGSIGSEGAAIPAELVPYALSTGSVAAVLRAVPNQPLQFAGEDFTRSEDEIIAYSYDKYLRSFEAGRPDMTWPALLPMTRAAVRAMDTIQDFMATRPRARAVINDFVISGASKRGWTTWLTAASDRRVAGIMPLVIDVLNMDAQMEHHYNAYGFYAPSIHDYVDSNIFERFGTPSGNSLLRIVDPYEHRVRLTMPKLVVNSSGDQFFLPDSSQFYWNDLPGSNWLLYAANTDHGLDGEFFGFDLTAFGSMFAFFNAVALDLTPPSYTWRLEDRMVTVETLCDPGDLDCVPSVEEKEGHALIVETTTQPEQVLLWQASNPEARDFRMEAVGPIWTSTPLENVCTDPLQECASGLYRYEGEVVMPIDGWTAFYVQLIFPGPNPVFESLKYGFSTQVYVTPDAYPSF